MSDDQQGLLQAQKHLALAMEALRRQQDSEQGGAESQAIREHIEYLKGRLQQGGGEREPLRKGGPGGRG